VRTITLTSPATRLHIAPEAGGRIAQVEARRGDSWLPLFIEPPPHTAADLAWGCYAMLPWPNRIAGGRFPSGGTMLTLDADRDGHALHGVGFARSWVVERVTPRSCTLSLDLGAAGWPFGGRALQRFEATTDGAAMEIELRAGATSYPAGAGWHPWFRRDIAGAEACVTLDADRYLELEGMIPTGRVLPIDAARDLRGGAPLGQRRLDDCYTGVRDPVVIRWGAVAVEMRQDPATAYAVVYTPAHAVCVEPQTCAIDAFNLTSRGIEAGVRIVSPGQPLIARSAWRIITGYTTSDAAQACR